MLNEKLNELLESKETELNVVIVDVTVADNGDAHVIAKKNFDGSFVVWSSYSTGEVETSHENLYSGFYCDKLVDAIEEQNNRVEKTKSTAKQTQEVDGANLAKVTYAYGVVSDGSSVLDWEEIEDMAIEILNDWHKFKDIQNIEEEGYIIPYAIRKWEEYMDEYVA